MFIQPSRKTLPFIFFILFVLLVLSACNRGSTEEAEQPSAVETVVEEMAQSEVITPEYIEYQWVDISIAKEGTVVLLDDETKEMTVLNVEIETTDTYTRTRIINQETHKRECDAINQKIGGGSASREGFASCHMDGTATLYGNWHLGSGTTIQATVIYSVFIPLNTNTEKQVVRIYGPNGWTNVEIEKHIDLEVGEQVITASIGETQICTAVYDGTMSVVNPSLGAYCDTDEEFGYGVVIFGNHESVEIIK